MFDHKYHKIKLKKSEQTEKNETEPKTLNKQVKKGQKKQPAVNKNEIRHETERRKFALIKKNYKRFTINQSIYLVFDDSSDPHAILSKIW